MGITGFYSYCKNQVPGAFKNVCILDEITKFKSEHDKSPVIIVNLTIMCYNYKANMGSFLVEHRINKIKNSFERIFRKMQDAGAELIFIFKRAKFDDTEFLKKSEINFRKAQDLIQKIEGLSDSKQIKKMLKNSGKLPYIILILLAMIQSAEKFGPVYQINSYDFKPAVAQSEFITNNNATWVIGLDNYFFLTTGVWKILADDTMDQKTMTMTEIDKNVIMDHFKLSPNHLPLYATLLGDFESNYAKKMTAHFGSVKKFENAANFVNNYQFPLNDESYNSIVTKIFGSKYDPKILKDLKNSIEQFVYREEEAKIDSEISQIFKNDILNYAPKILMKKVPIFIAGIMIDFLSDHTNDFNDLVLPWIQKTAGILLKNSEDKQNCDVIMMNPKKGKYETVSLNPIYPDFNVPPLKEIISGNLATYDKEKILFFVIGEKLEKMEIPSFGEHTIIDGLILLYLINKKKITILEGRCILKTIVESRNRTIILEGLNYPKMINTRAIRCSFLYMNLFFELHSCLSALGMKNYCPEFIFDGLYFQKIYALNVLGEKDENHDDENLTENKNVDINEKKFAQKEINPQKVEKNYTQTEIVDSFAKILSL